MKKLLFAALMFFALSGTSYAQKPFKVFIELLGHQKGLFSDKVKITVDYGQAQTFFNKKKNQTLVDENGKKIAFNSMVDAMNYFGEAGWDFEQAYVVTDDGESVYHWLLSKEVTSPEQITEGFNTRSMYKQSLKE